MRGNIASDPFADRIAEFASLFAAIEVKIEDVSPVEVLDEFSPGVQLDSEFG